MSYEQIYNNNETKIEVDLEKQHAEEIKKQEKCTLEDAVRIALNQVIGAYAIVVMDKNNPNQLIAARKGSPLVLGIGEKEFFIASDASPIVEYTKNVVYLDDQEYAVINRTGDFYIKTLGNVEKSPAIQKLEMSIEAIEKPGPECP